MGAIVRETVIDGRPVRFMASARTPRLYRMKFDKDIVADMAALSKRFEEVKDSEDNFSYLDLKMFENMAYIMAKQADPVNVPDDIDEWLDDFSVFAIYQVMPILMDLWQENMAGLSTSKKK